MSSVTVSSETYVHETSLPTDPAIAESSAEGERARRQFAEALRGRRGQGKERLHEGVKLSYFYDGSPIIWPDESKTQAKKNGNGILSCRSGSRAPHAWLGENISTLDLFGDGFVLLRFGRSIDASSLVAAAAARRVPLKIVDIDNRDIAALYERKLVLVRPDGPVAWRADASPDDASVLIDRVRGHIEP